jgi:hypothetical protein
MITTINTRWESTQRVTATKGTILTHNIAIQLHLVAKSCTICSSRSRRPVRKLLDTHSCFEQRNTKYELQWPWSRPTLNEGIGNCISIAAVQNYVCTSNRVKWIECLQTALSQRCISFEIWIPAKRKCQKAKRSQIGHFKPTPLTLRQILLGRSNRGWDWQDIYYSWEK